MTSATDPNTSAASAAATQPAISAAPPLVMSIILACGGAHLINDMIQALLPSIYPMLKTGYGLSFTQVGLITLTFQVTASLLQPWIGMYTDRPPVPSPPSSASYCWRWPAASAPSWWRRR